MGQALKCPHCGEAGCQLMRPRRPLLLGFTGLAIALVLTGAAVLTIQRFTSAQESAFWVTPILLLAAAGVGALWTTRFECNYECPTCRARFRYQRID